MGVGGILPSVIIQTHTGTGAICGLCHIPNMAHIEPVMDYGNLYMCILCIVSYVIILGVCSRMLLIMSC